MNNEKKLALGLLLGFILVMVVSLYVSKQIAIKTVRQIQEAGSQNVGSVDLNRFVKAPTNTIGSCTSTSGTLVATSTSRQYVAIVNDSANTVYLSLGKAAVGSNGIRLNANGGTFEMGSEALFTGAINCIASSTSVMTVVEANLAN